MKIDFRGNNFIVFLNKKYSEKIDFLDKEELETYFRKLFIKFKDTYDIDVCGSYNIEVFTDNNYGIILSIKQDDVDYFEYYSDQIDMSIVISKYDQFIYKLIGNLDETVKKNCEFCIYDNDVYVIPKNIDFIDIGYLVENSEIVYGRKAYDVIHNGFKVIDSLYVC